MFNNPSIFLNSNAWLVNEPRFIAQYLPLTYKN
jgi:hypothetical protein